MPIEVVDAGAELEVEVEHDHPAEGEDAVVEGRHEEEVVRVLGRALRPRSEERPQLRDGATVAPGERAQVVEVEIDSDIWKVPEKEGCQETRISVSIRRI